MILWLSWAGPMGGREWGGTDHPFCGDFSVFLFWCVDLARYGLVILLGCGSAREAAGYVMYVCAYVCRVTYCY
ncbi:hypothetical protein BDV29DRAFT_176388 [Aspergillus leporis]|uniref:Uncharacterized protein n=1 Tax=Aspergillus leporis TaxID=41062 RepID=A0A5N5X0P9_9EURO|nr:hypothetical protein BDV29DRAFT_176388 [Aspergillus leporis]